MLEKSRITLHNVAALAGVSHQTVSRVINNSNQVRPETREKVEAAILELGYRPNAIARSMVQGQTHTLGCISPNITDPVFTRIIESAQAEARRQGFFILIGSAPTVQEVQPLLDELLNRRVDGLIVLNARDDERHELLGPLANNGSPIVYVKNSPLDEPVSSVRCDDIHGGYVATKHLLDLGHRNIAIILGPKNEQCTLERLDGYRMALDEAGQQLSEELIVQGNWSSKSGSNAAEQLLSNPKSFSAIFAQNDRMAAGAIRSIRDAGYQIPDDYSVIGYDNGPLASLIDPPLTTIQQPLEQFGEQAAHILIKMIQESNFKPVDLCLTPELILRRSSSIVSSRNNQEFSKEVVSSP
ncbi:MAG: LacI family transcriptional regulator [Anaerolineales bacterium]|nr:LacI family transcriptional regulator [Anaerolineales bacterium]